MNRPRTKPRNLLLAAAATALMLAPGSPVSAQQKAAETATAAPAVRSAQTTKAAAKAAVGLSGRVLGERSPLGAARVYAYQLADFTLHQAVTTDDGRFQFADLPAGLYKVIAHKGGFVPAVIMLTRARTDAEQFLELELVEQGADAAAVEDFWSVRERIPADVLRAIGRTETRIARHSGGDGDDGGPSAAHRLADQLSALSSPAFATEVQAMTGVDQAAGADAVLTGGQVGVEGKMGNVNIGLTGDYWRVGPDESSIATTTESADGRSRQFVLSLSGDGADGTARLDLASRTRSYVGGGDDLPVFFEAHRASWTQPLGERSNARLTGYYTSQSNYYSQGLTAPEELPRASHSWGVEGTFDRRMSERSNFQTGFQYRDRTIGSRDPLSGPATPQSRADEQFLEDERLDLFGRAGVRIQPAVLVEYGLYTTLRDGSLSLQPQGGVVLQLSDRWQASALASHKLAVDGTEGPRDFIPALYQESNACTQGEASCYKVLLAYNGDESTASSLSLSAVQREIGETLRLFFDDDFFGHLETLTLVRGDEVPEIGLGVSRKVAPAVVTRFRTNMGEGGGGIFYATDRERYENSVRYVVTSLDTQFTATATGVFVSFHHLEQQLAPLGAVPSANQDLPAGTLAAILPGERTDLELQRLQLMLTQDLNILMDLAADWAVKIDMELSRGSLLLGEPSGEELRRKVLGGFAVRF